MGLDMHLDKLEANNDRQSLIYWGKVYQIFGWFERNCANGEITNCESVTVSKFDLVNLLRNINTVLDDHSKAEKILPITEGLFFDRKEYDERYFMELQYSKEEIERVLDDLTENDKLEFWAWW